MSKESTQPCKTLRDVAQKLGRYTEDAYDFVRQGLEYASKAIHGPMTPSQFVVTQYMSAERVDLPEVLDRRTRGDLDPMVTAAVDQAGGYEQLNRNVSGQDLCWCLRDFAWQRWGLLAKLVLERWGIERTADFGRIVFDLVEHDFMQQESHDSMDDFNSVYEFASVMKEAYEVSDHMKKPK